MAPAPQLVVVLLATFLVLYLVTSVRTLHREVDVLSEQLVHLKDSSQSSSASSSQHDARLKDTLEALTSVAQEVSRQKDLLEDLQAGKDSTQPMRPEQQQAPPLRQEAAPRKGNRRPAAVPPGGKEVCALFFFFLSFFLSLVISTFLSWFIP